MLTFLKEETQNFLMLIYLFKLNLIFVKNQVKYYHCAAGAHIEPYIDVSNRNIIYKYEL